MKCLFCQQTCIPIEEYDGMDSYLVLDEETTIWLCLKCSKETIYYDHPTRGLHCYMIKTNYKDKLYCWSFYPKAQMCYISIVEPFWSPVIHFAIMNNITPSNIDTKLPMVLIFL